MPKVKGRHAAEEVYGERVQISSVIFGLVMIVAIIVAGAALLGGSLSKAGQRWSNAMDGMSRGVGLSVETVEVIGLEHVPATARQVKMAAMIEPGENMFRADPHLIRRRIEETRLVAKVQVFRLWPDTVMIYADAAEPSALWLNGQDWAVVDNLGRLMPKLRATDHVDLVKAVGTGSPEAVPALARALAIIPGLQRSISHAERIGGRRWNLVLTNGAVVKLPNDESVIPGMLRLAELNREAKLTQRDVSSIDLRVAGRVFLTPKAAGAVEEAA